MGSRQHYRRLAAGLRNRILAGEWGDQEVLPSLRALASQYTSGVKAVRLAIAALSREGMLELNPARRWVAIVEQKSEYADSLPVLLVLSWVLDRLLGQPGPRALLNGIFHASRDLETPFLIRQGSKNRTGIPRDLAGARVQGAILIGPFNGDVIRKYEALGIPAVMLDRPGESQRLHSVSVANEEAAADATRRLWAMGHRKIAFLQPIYETARGMDPDAAAREKGYRLALKEAGVRDVRKWSITHLRWKNRPAGAFQALFSERPRFTAVLAPSASLARGVLKAAASSGLVVPRDLSVAGFQSRGDETMKCCGPSVDFRAMGQAAFELLFKPRNPSRHLRLPAPWTEGGTTGPPPSRA